MQAQSLAALLPRRVHLSAAGLELVHGEAARQLREHGGLGALLRY
jgi:hypothetical protein